MTKATGLTMGPKTKVKKGVGLTETCMNYSTRCCGFHLILLTLKLVLLTLKNEVDSICPPKQSQEETDAMFLQRKA